MCSHCILAWTRCAVRCVALCPGIHKSRCVSYVTNAKRTKKQKFLGERHLGGT